MKNIPSLAMLAISLLALPCSAQDLPHLQRVGNATQLIVDGKPYLALGGELHNSSAGTAQQADAILPKLARAHLNTVVMPVSWELIESTEGHFDFGILDHWVAVARTEHLHLVLLWFGSWKNSTSSYTPAWVKQDTKRFPRAVAADGSPLEILSTFSGNNLRADQAAFRALMRHVKDTDAGQHTVLMVQVENEVGVIGSTRDRSREADREFGSQVPAALIADLKEHPERMSPELRSAWKGNASTWGQAFSGDAAASEVFMAWHYASYIGQVAAAGKAEYALPMYVNAQLPAPHERPGEYPSGGPHPYYLEVWRAAAPALDFFSPDIYWPNVDYWCERYSENNNALFIPEIRFDTSPFTAFYALGEAHAFGFSPFGIEDVPDPAAKPDAAAKSAARSDLLAAYNVLSQLSGVLPQAQSEGRSRGVLLQTTSFRSAVTVSLGGYLFRASLARSYPANLIEQDTGAMIVLEQAPGDFLIGGAGLKIDVSKDLDQGPGTAGILSVEQGSLQAGQWQTTARLNGDEDNQGRSVALPAHAFKLLRVKLYTVEP